MPLLFLYAYLSIRYFMEKGVIYPPIKGIIFKCKLLIKAVNILII